jgi:glycosyltransferase EpsD
MAKVLFISNTANFSKFNRPFMRWFRDNDWQVDYVSAGEEDIMDCDNQYTISIKRTPYNLKNIRAYKELKKILFLNNYDIIHCHTPMGGFLGRLAAKNINTKTKVIYTAHGFHFYKGAPIINWLLYYPIEKYLIKYTDCLITLNNEDFNFADKILKAHSQILIYKIDGVGIDLNRFKPSNKDVKDHLRGVFGLSKTDFIILYIAEFIPRKNHRLLIEKSSVLKNHIKELKIIFAGTGPLFDKYKKKVKDTDLSETVLFFGYRNDIEKLCNIADVAVLPSKQEGLPLGMIECLATGLPIVCSRIRGHIDVIADRRNGLLFDLNKPAQMVDSIFELYNDSNFRNTIIENNLNDRGKYSLDTAILKMSEIYKHF